VFFLKTVYIAGVSQTIRTTFWTRHDTDVCYDDGPMTSPVHADDVTESIVLSGHGKRLEMNMLVTSTGTVSGDDVEPKRHPSGNSVKPERMLINPFTPIVDI